jgi:ubiquinone/menaquinone biosynthesis C-methylase UbiE
VIGIDSSSEQLSAALKKDNITYRKGLAESTGVEGKSVDLVTVAQALHWSASTLNLSKMIDLPQKRGKYIIVDSSHIRLIIQYTPLVRKCSF